MRSTSLLSPRQLPGYPGSVFLAHVASAGTRRLRLHDLFIIATRGRRRSVCGHGDAASNQLAAEIADHGTREQPEVDDQAGAYA